MALNIKNAATVALADELARRQGLTKTAGIHQALSERLHRMGYGDMERERLLGELRAIRERVARLPELDSRSDEEIIGYDEKPPTEDAAPPTLPWGTGRTAGRLHWQGIAARDPNLGWSMLHPS